MQVLYELYDILSERRANYVEGSYSCYLFKEGLDKILKKIGEESAETIIAAKNGDKADVVLESCDLLFHLLALLNECEIPLEAVEAELVHRRQKQGNLKPKTASDKNT